MPDTFKDFDEQFPDDAACPCDWARMALTKVIRDRQQLAFALRLFVSQYAGHADRETRPEMKAARAILAEITPMSGQGGIDQSACNAKPEGKNLG